MYFSLLITESFVRVPEACNLAKDLSILVVSKRVRRTRSKGLKTESEVWANKICLFLKGPSSLKWRLPQPNLNVFSHDDNC